MSVFTALLFLLSLGISRAANTLDVELSQSRINYSPVDYTFTLKADSYTDIASGSTIEIQFPSDYSSIFPTSPVCNDDAGKALTCSGSTSTSKVTITNYFASATTDRTFNFKISSLSNPSHTGNTGSFSVAIISPSKNTILTASNTVTITEGSATCSITTDSNVIGATTKIKFNITPTNLVSANGGLEVTFPKWSSQGESMVSSPNAITCQLTSPTSRTPGNCYMSSDNVLNVDSVMTAQITPGTLITLEFSSIKNPPLADPYTFQIRTLDSNGLGVDKCTPTLKVTTPNAIIVNSNNFLTCITNSNKKQINTVETCILSFKTTNPLPKGAAIDIRFPSEVGISSSFKVNEDSPVSINSLNIVSSYPNIKLVNAVSAYTAAGTEFDIRFITIRHPSTTQPTSSFQITTSMNGNPIDTITSGVSYTASPGDISSLKITADPTEVGSTADINFSFKVKNSVTTVSQLRIVFPNEFTTGTSIACTGTGTKMVSTPTCSVSSRVLTVSNYASNTISSSDTVSITVKSITLPSSSKPTSVFDISTQENGYQVDRNNLLSFQADPAVITNNVALSLSSGAQVGGNSDYVISFQNRNPIPASGKFFISLPSDNTVSISNPSIAATDTKAEIKGVLMTFPTTVSSTEGTLVFSNPSQSEIASGTSIKITIPSLMNPPNTGVTASFTVRTQTSDGYTIDLISTGLNIKANAVSASDFKYANLDLNPSTTGATSTYNFTFIPKVLHTASNILTINFPTTYTFKSTVTCTVIKPQPQPTTNCYPSPSKELSFSLGQDVQALQAFEVDIAGVVNPGLAGSYSGFSMATQVSGNARIHQTLSGITVNIDPAVISDISMERTTKLLSQPAVFTFSFAPKNQYPSDGYIEVVVPAQLSIRSSSALVCNGIQGFGQDPTCTLKSGTTRTILITGGGPYSSTRVKFSLDSLINQATQIDSDSFKIYIKDSKGNIIDQAITGLVAMSPCDSNCLTCQDDNRYACTSCAIGKLYDIVNLKCVDTCPAKTYQDNTQCKACHSSCLQCQGPNSNQCTACNTTSSLPSLYQQQCLNECPSTYYANSVGVCKACVSPCQTCTSSTQCSTCISGTFLYNQQCNNYCPSGYFKDTTARKCQACKSNCLTCNTLTTCSSCDTSSKFPIFFNNDCLSKCPDGYFPSDNTCLPCQSPCTTCLATADYCLSCTPGLYADSGVCKACSSPCRTCSGSKNTCTSCDTDDLVLQNSKCVAGCSSGYYLDFMTRTCYNCPTNCLTCASSKQCTLCDPASSTPFLSAGSCVEACPADTTTITANKECLNQSEAFVARINPYTGIYLSGLPFPFVIFGLIFSVLSFVGRMVSDSTLVVSNIIGFFSLLELTSWLTFIILISLSHPDEPVDTHPGLPLALVGFIISFGLNIAFYIRVIRPLTKEEAFIKWTQERKSNKISSFIGQGLSLISFKAFRLIYSRFFGVEALSARIPKPRAFMANLNKFTGINFFFSVLFVLIAAIVTLSKDSDFPQLLYISIEILIISLLTTILTIYDALRANEAEPKNVIPDDDLLAAQSKVLSMLGKSIMDKLNESLETGGKDLKRLSLAKNRNYRRRNSLNLDSSCEFNESELQGLEAGGSFLRLNSTFNERKIGQSIDYKRNEESFNESMDGGHMGREHEIIRIQAIKENEREEDDDEPGVYSRNTLFAGSRNELNPDRIFIEHKDGSITQLGGELRMIKGSPMKSQLKSSRREYDGRNSAVIYEAATNRQQASSRSIGVGTGEFALKERNVNENVLTGEQMKGVSAKKGKKGQEGTDNSEDELELHDSYVDIENKGMTNSQRNTRVGHAKVIRDYMQEANRLPGVNNDENDENQALSGRNQRPSYKDKERYEKSNKKQETLESYRLSNLYASPEKTKRGQRTAEKGKKGEGDREKTMEVEDFENEGRENYLSGKKNTGFSSSKKRTPYKVANEAEIRRIESELRGSPFKGITQPRSGKKTEENERRGLDYVSSDSQSFEGDKDDYFQGETPNMYNALNQRYEDDVQHPSQVIMSQNNVETALQASQTQVQGRDSPQKPTIVQNFTGEDEVQEEKPAREYVQREYPASKGEIEAREVNYNNRAFLRDKEGYTSTVQKRAATPQTYAQEFGRGIKYQPNQFGNVGYKTSDNFMKEKKKEEAKDPSLSFGKMTEKERQEKLERLENIYTGKKKRGSGLKSSGKKKKGSQNSIDDNMGDKGVVDNEDLEISNFGRFEDFVNEMKKQGQDSVGGFEAESFDNEEL